MGLETIFYEHYDRENPNDNEPSISWWRKCSGINNWLISKASKKIDDCVFEFDTSVLNDVITTMGKYIKKLAEKANFLGYFVEDIESLRSLVAKLYDEEHGYDYKDYKILEKIIKSFNCNDLTFDDFEESIWDSLSNFVDTYKNFVKSVQYPTLILIESY